jgi:hypothetical protein
MGLLDDAIREHLELKRSRGADPTEVSRQEDEALGPVRRDRGEAAASEEEPELAADQELPPEDQLAAEEATQLHDVEAGVPGAEEGGAEAAARPFDLEADAKPGSAATAREPDEWGFDDEPEPEPEPEEDPLEETPDFLQETPEHDRLWFEQKPPRDFDFDA